MIALWDLRRRWQLRRSLRGHSGAVATVAAVGGPRSDLMVSGGADATVRVWRVSSGAPLYSMSDYSQGQAEGCRRPVGRFSFPN